MDAVAIILIVVVLGVAAYGAYLSVEQDKWYERFHNLESWLDSCSNTVDNWHEAIAEADIIKKSKLIKDPDMAALERKIYEKFLLKPHQNTFDE